MMTAEEIAKNIELTLPNDKNLKNAFIEAVLASWEAQIRQDQKKKDCYICWCADKNTQPTDLSDLIMEAK